MWAVVKAFQIGLARLSLAVAFLVASCGGQPVTGHTSSASPAGSTGTVTSAAVPSTTSSPSHGPTVGTGAWSTTTAMSTSRSYHSATRLPSGKVLVAGGYTGGFNSNALASTELFDPATSTWSASAPMLRPHAAHTATLLENGKVLVVAGRSTGGDSTAAELYDPAHNLWSPGGNIIVARTTHKALLLRSGKVLIWGGFGPAGVNPPAELYDPDANGWSVIPATNEHFINDANVLPDGRILALGDIENYSFQFAGIFDPVTSVWTSVRRPPVSMAFSVALSNGNVLFYGNYAPGNPRLAEEYDPATNTWSLTSAMRVALFGQPILLRDGRVLVTGSAMNVEPGCGSGCPNAEVFAPSDGSWTLTKPMAIDRGEQSTTLLADGRVLVAGGFIPPNPDTNAAVEIFDPAG